MSKSPRKSIVASFGLLSAELENDQAVEQPSAPATPAVSTSNRVGAGVIGAAHRAIDDIRAERDRFKALVEAGGGAVRDMDALLIDPSPYPDRLPDDDSSDFEAFKRSIQTEGQKVPIQVRIHPSAPGRYQVVYGHRRWLAAKQLGLPVRAIEVEISDLDLVVAQGIENASRQDLTWIERALFAFRMDEAGIRPRDIYAALSIEDAELARMRSVYRSVPADIIEAIGRAPKIGRPRWLDLAKTITSDKGALESLRAMLSMPNGPVETSDQRFQRALGAIKPGTKVQEKSVPIAGPDGTRFGSCLRAPKEVRILAEGMLGIEFLKFVETELPSLAERFAHKKDNGSS